MYTESLCKSIPIRSCHVSGAWARAYQRQGETAESQAGAVSLTNDTSFVAEKISKPGLFETGRIGIF